MLNSDILWGWMKQAAGAARRRWGRLTHNSAQVTAGELDTVIGLLLEACGHRERQAEAEVDRLLADWQASRP
jgi:uncharacterized protein YjbJ (UPF0337 family)